MGDFRQKQSDDVTQVDATGDVEAKWPIHERSMPRAISRLNTLAGRTCTVPPIRTEMLFGIGQPISAKSSQSFGRHRGHPRPLENAWELRCRRAKCSSG